MTTAIFEPSARWRAGSIAPTSGRTAQHRDAYGTLQLTTEGIDEPIRALEQARASQRVSESAFRTLAFAETAYFTA
jgi:hypothetical protein